MSDKNAIVSFSPSGVSVSVKEGTTLLEAARRAGLALTAPCGGQGTCGQCRVTVAGADVPVSEADRRVLSPEALRTGVRLACATSVSGDTLVTLAPCDAGETNHRILEDDGKEHGVFVEPAVAQSVLHLGVATREHALSDVERVCEEVNCDRFAPHALRAVPEALYGYSGAVDVTLRGRTVIDVKRASKHPCLGVAFDIGTTTVVGALVDLASGSQMAAASRVNPQTKRGDDVLSRIRICREEPDGLAGLAASVRGAIDEVLDELCAETGVRRYDIFEIAVAGNTAMQQIFAAISPAALGEMPFVPAFKRPLSVPAAWAGLALHPECELHIFPQLGGFVGGDTVAGILATDLDRRDGVSLLVDVGTNGEIVLAASGKLIATSVAAGPAFEGARIRHGMRGAAGAIDSACINGDLSYTTIDNIAPAGICGSGLVDLAAAFLNAGLIDETGRILPPDELGSGVPAPLRARLVEGEDGHADILLVPGAETVRGMDILLYQRDVRELQLANGAIRAGIHILLRRAGLEPKDVDTVYLAGAFGNYINKTSALRIGMLPEINANRILSAGNTALRGARKFLLSLTERRRVWDILRLTQHVDLSTDPDFQMEFGVAMMFPSEAGA